MKFNTAVFIVVFSFMIALFATWSAHAKPLSYNGQPLVNYANNYSEFSVSLPEAPSVRSLWADKNEDVPYINTQGQSGFVGEVAFYETTDSKSNDKFMLEITFLKAPTQFIEQANEATLLSVIKKDLDYLPEIKNIKIKYDDQLNKPAKHAIVEGTTTTADAIEEMNAEHFLVGTQSLLIIKAKFNSRNMKHLNLYKAISDSIKYLPL